MRETLQADVAVLGTGISGFSVAESLHAKGKSVVLLSPSHSPAGAATALSSGIWDVGPVPLAYWKNAVPFRELVRAPQWTRPLTSLLHNDASLFDPDKGFTFSASHGDSRIFTSLFHGAEDRPALLPVEGGAFRAAYSAQKIIFKADATAWARKRVGIVVCPQWRLPTELWLPLWADALREQGTSAELVPFKIALKGFDWPLSQLAARLASDANVAQLFRGQIKEALKNTPVDVLLFPPLFLDTEMALAWEKEWNVTVAEFASVTEPVAGERLSETIRKCRQDLAIEWIPVQTVRQLSLRQNTFLVTSQAGEVLELKTKAVVLCTGKFLGGGLESKDRFRESVLDLPLFTSREKGQVVYQDDVAIADRYRLGLWLDEYHRPRSLEGTVAENLFASGSVVGGMDFAAQRFGLGFFSWLGRHCGKKINEWLG